MEPKEKYKISPEYDQGVDKDKVASNAANLIKRYDGGDTIIYNSADWGEDGSISNIKRMIFKVVKKYNTREDAIGPLPKKIMLFYDRKNQFVIARDKMDRPYLFSFDRLGHATAFPVWLKKTTIKNMEKYSESYYSENLNLLIEELRTK